MSKVREVEHFNAVIVSEVFYQCNENILLKKVKKKKQQKIECEKR